MAISVPVVSALAPMGIVPAAVKVIWYCVLYVPVMVVPPLTVRLLTFVLTVPPVIPVNAYRLFASAVVMIGVVKVAVMLAPLSNQSLKARFAAVFIWL